MTFYRFLFAVDTLILLTLGYFCLDGLQYSSASDSFAIWLPILGGLIAILAGARALKNAGRHRLAVTVLLLPAVPATIFVLFFGLLLAANPSWQ